jgi:O-antigen ligase
MQKLLIYIFLATWPLLSIITLVDFGKGIPNIDVLRPATLLFLFMTLLHILLNRKKNITDKIIYCCFIFSLYFILNLYIRESASGFSGGVASLIDLYLVPISVYFTLINYQEELNPKVLVWSIIFSGVLIAGTGIVEFVAGHNVIGLPSRMDVMEYSTSSVYRTNGPFYDIVGYSGIVLLYIPFTYYFIKEKIINKHFASACIVLFTLGCLISYSRASMIAFLLVFLILISGKNIKSLLGGFYLFIVIIILAYVYGETMTGSKLFTERISNKANVVGRMEQYWYCLKLFINRPIFGIGYGMYLKNYSIQVHNSYLRALVEFGLIGFIPYICFIFSIIFRKFKEFLTGGNIPLYKARLCLVVIVLFVCNTIDLLNNRHFMLVLLITIAAFNPDTISEKTE